MHVSFHFDKWDLIFTYNLHKLEAMCFTGFFGNLLIHIESEAINLLCDNFVIKISK